MPFVSCRHALRLTVMRWTGRPAFKPPGLSGVSSGGSPSPVPDRSSVLLDTRSAGLRQKLFSSLHDLAIAAVAAQSFWDCHDRYGSRLQCETARV